ncbi:MAG: hypothetical protein WC175_04080, partial [Candidatus Dojkabacteria bacterium]
MIGQAFLPYMMRRGRRGLALPPLYQSLLTWYKSRDASTVIDEISKKNAELIFDPATEIIDLSKYTDDIVSDTLGGIACDSITFNVVGGK